MKSHILLALLLIFLVTALSVNIFTGCNDDSVTPPADNFDFSGMSTPDTSDAPINDLQLDTVKILLKDIKLNVSDSGDSTNFKVGPLVLKLNLNSSLNTISSAYIPPGTYDKVKFEVHKLAGSELPPDPEFVDGNGRYSVIVKGSYRGFSFVYKSDKSAHQKLDFPNSLIVTSAGKSNITLHVRPYIWFVKNGVYLDPRIPANANDIDNNIKNNINNNFKAFKDNDRNGLPDN